MTLTLDVVVRRGSFTLEVAAGRADVLTGDPAFRDRYHEAAAEAETAEVLGISANNVAVRVNRGRNELKKALGDER